VSGIFLPLRVNSLPLATIYEVKIPLRKWKKSLLQRNPAQMTWANECSRDRGSKVLLEIAGAWWVGWCLSQHKLSLFQSVVGAAVHRTKDAQRYCSWRVHERAPRNEAGAKV
jgi:hypothetical protein